MAENQRNVGRTKDEDYLMRRALTCGRCGGAVQCESSRSHRAVKYLYYKCTAQRHKMARVRQCDQASFRADWVDTEIWNWIKALLSDPDKLHKALTELEREGERMAAPIRRRLDTLDELIAEGKADLERVKEMCRRGIYGMDEAAHKKAQLETLLGRQVKER